MCAGFLVFLYVNPPGHESWYQFVGTMVIASMPQLSGFDELGLFMFTFFPRELLLQEASRNVRLEASLVQVYRILGGSWKLCGKTSPLELILTSTKDQMRNRTKYWKGVLQ